MTIIGFRRWQVVDGMLFPTGVPTAGPWGAGRQTAACAQTWNPCDCWSCRTTAPDRGHSDAAPLIGCRCGFYARKMPIAACGCSEPTSPAHGAVGVVRIGGRMVEHERGWRAQYAEIAALVDFTGTVDRRTYPVPIYPDLNSMYGEWAPGIEDRDAVVISGRWCGSLPTLITRGWASSLYNRNLGDTLDLIGLLGNRSGLKNVEVLRDPNGTWIISGIDPDGGSV